MISSTPPYRCITCLARAASLYKTAADQYIKLSECEQCGSVVDRYVECEASVVIIDMMLLDITAYRHVLHNSTFATSIEGLIRAMACLVLCGGYYSWSTVLSSTSVASTSLQPSYSQETFFYCMCLLAAAQLLVHVVFVCGFCHYRKTGYSLLQCSRAAVVGQLSTVLHIPASVWQLSQWPLYGLLAAIYTALTASHTLAGMVGCGVVEAGAVVATSALASNLLSAAVLYFLPS